jgi:hypothetical protein
LEEITDRIGGGSEVVGKFGKKNEIFERWLWLGSWKKVRSGNGGIRKKKPSF